jgi:uncharacterized protein YcsI (UPF0317 family)
MDWTRLSPVALRQAIREGKWTGPTGALAPGFEQGNVVILPEAMAGDFRLYCQRNPKPCPLMAEGRPGDPMLPVLGAGIDLRTDLPRYRVFRAGESPADVTDISDLWRGDLVAFVLGCSLSFEAALVQADVRLRHYELGTTCTAYMSDLKTVPAGPFETNLIVTMRAIRRDQSERVIALTRGFSQSHGEPVHVGDPAAIGIKDLADTYEDIGLNNVQDDEVPMFWACGVTALEAVRAAAPDLFITHAPAHMLITDRPAVGGGTGGSAGKQ